ncbi:MAG: hypothetical protein E7264_07735 [Lachnospiraceae bacterium]|nr:hypothetical protein [Lachnospiraceae bacterium]
MEKRNRPSKQVDFRVRIGGVLLLIASLVCIWGMPVEASTSEEDAIYTSTESVLNKTYDELLDSLDEQVFGDYISTLNYGDSYVIPGIDQTNIRNKKVSNGMIPQGICVADEYLIISAYDASHKVVVDTDLKGSKKQKSVLYVMDVESRQYLTTITLNTKCHVGALAYNPDERIVYVADSNNGLVQRVSMDKIECWVNNGKDAHDDVLEFDSGAIDTQGYCPSLLSYYDGHLYVGQFARKRWGEWFANRMVAFDAEGTLLTKYALEIPYYAQGVSFAEWNDKVYMLVSASYGRENEANITVYQMEKDYNDVLCHKERLGQFSCPNMSEDIEIQGDAIYTCYESASNFYRLSLDDNGTSLNAVDRIMVSSFRKTMGMLLAGDETRYIHHITKLPIRTCKYDRLTADVDDRRRSFLRLF